MLWLLITISAYFFLAIVSLFDRYFLAGSIPNPKVYTFYVGIMWFLICLILLPFGIDLPKSDFIILGIATGIIRILAVLFLAKSIVKSEISRVVPAIGGFVPIFSFLLFFFYFPKEEILNLAQVGAFILLLAGSVLISFKRLNKEFLSIKILKYPITSAFLFAFAFFLTKILFLKTDFLSGFFLILVGGGVGALSFLISSPIRKLIFSQRPNQKISVLFLLGQICAGLGSGLQYFAIFLARPFQVPLVNALEGIRHVFLLSFIFILAIWRPNLLKEEMRGLILVQKIFAILLIGAGLILLAFK